MIDEKVLIERLEELYQPCYLCREDRCAIDRAIEIAKELAEERNTSTVNSAIKEKFVAELERTLNNCNGDYMCIGTDIQKYLLEVLRREPAPYQPKGE